MAFEVGVRRDVDRVARPLGPGEERLLVVGPARGTGPLREVLERDVADVRGHARVGRVRGQRRDGRRRAASRGARSPAGGPTTRASRRCRGSTRRSRCTRARCWCRARAGCDRPRRARDAARRTRGSCRWSGRGRAATPRPVRARPRRTPIATRDRSGSPTATGQPQPLRHRVVGYGVVVGEHVLEAGDDLTRRRDTRDRDVHRAERRRDAQRDRGPGHARVGPAVRGERHPDGLPGRRDRERADERRAVARRLADPRRQLELHPARGVRFTGLSRCTPRRCRGCGRGRRSSGSAGSASRSSARELAPRARGCRRRAGP